MGEKSVKFKIEGKKKSFGVRDIFRVFDAKNKALFAPTHIKDGKIKISGSNPKKYRIFDRARSEGILSFAEVLADGDIIVYTFGGGGSAPMQMNSFSGTMTGEVAHHPIILLLKNLKMRLSNSGVLVVFYLEACLKARL